MTILPIVLRELSVQARRRNTYWIRVAGSAVASGLMLWFFVVAAAPGAFMAQGRLLFDTLSLLAFLYCLFIGPLVTADSLSSEKREGTLGLLFLTDLKGHDVVLGKLVSSSAQAVSGLLAIVPMLSVALLLGGVGAAEIIRTVLVLGNTLFLSLSAAICVSTVSQHERKAVFSAFFLVLLVAGLPFHLNYVCLSNNFFETRSVSDASFLSPSPAFAFYLSRQSTPTPADLSAFYGSLAQTHALAWAFFALSSLLVPHVWKDRPQGKPRLPWSQRWRDWKYRQTRGRAAIRYRLRVLERNPCTWLSNRHRYKAHAVWALVLPLGIMGLGVYLKYPNVFYEAALFLIPLLHFFIKVWFVAETCGRWVEDRATGLLELLLCAPLRKRDLVKGQNIALWRHFGAAAIVVLILTMLAWAGILWLDPGTRTDRARHWLLALVLALPADFFALRWVGLWRGLTGSGLNRAMAATLWQVLGWRWLGYLLVASVAVAWAWTGLGRLPVLTSPFLWLALALAFDVTFALAARRKFFRYCRVVAATPGLSRKLIEESSADVEEQRVSRGLSTGLQPDTRKNRGLGYRRRKWVWIGIGSALLLAGPLGYRYWLQRKVQHRVARLQSQGRPMGLREYYNAQPFINPETNAAAIIDALSLTMVRVFQLPLSVQQNLPGSGKREFFVGGEPLDPATKKAIRAALATNNASMEALRLAGRLRHGRYAEFWPGAVDAAVRQRATLVTALSMLEFEVLLRTDEGDADRAVEALQALFDLGHSLGNEWFAWELRRSFFLKAIRGCQRLLTRQALSSSHLTALSAELDQIDVAAGISKRIEWMRAWQGELFQSGFDGEGPMALGVPPAEVFRRQLRRTINQWSGRRDRQFLFILDELDHLSLTLSEPWPERFERARNLLTKRPGPTAVDSYNSVEIFNYVIKRAAELEAYRRAALTVLAIERFRRENGDHLPARLEELEPAFLPKVPPDPFNGKPLHYARRPSGYSVYSVGSNGLDDGGGDSGQILNQGAPPLDVGIRIAW